MNRPCLLACALVLATACSASGERGSACNVDTDCQDGLACDLHEEAGTCQTPHHHDDDDGAAGAAGAAGSAGAADH